jgi:hypothetical protein
MKSLVFGIVAFSSSSWPSWFWIKFKGLRDPYACAYGFFKRLDCLEAFPLSHFHDHHDFGFDAKLKNLKVFKVYWSHILIIVVLVSNSKALVQMNFFVEGL